MDARLNVFESLSHGQHLADPQSSETKSYFLELSTFFNTALAK